MRILIIEDEEPIADLLYYGLAREGFEVMTANTGEDGLKALESFRPEMLLLDWMLPDISGLDICKMVTERWNIPIIMITARSYIDDRVRGLEMGADDYITKPFDMREVIARINTIYRRLEKDNWGGPADDAKIIRTGEIEILPEEMVVKLRGEEVPLTPKEYELLLYMYNNRGKVLSRTLLLDTVWGYDFYGDTRTVDIHVQRLRKKLDLHNTIQTVFGVGYKFAK
ncbi:MAG: response regulator transcription factor [Eubacteriales bacterium]|nr:response regulator transcription factor [Eubacteriales bacterium]